MSTRKQWLWRSISMLMVMMMAFAAVSPATARVPSASPAQAPSGPVASQPAAQAPQSTAPQSPAPAEKSGPQTKEVVLAKIHPDLRDLAQTATPALPAVAGAQATAAAEPIFVQVNVRVDRENPVDISSYFEAGQVIARPVIGVARHATQSFFGLMQPYNLMKVAALGSVEALLPIVFEQNGYPDDMPIDDTRPAPAPKGPADWAALRQRAEALRAGSLSWDQARAFGDGRPAPNLPTDWFEVMPEGPHKAQAAWERGFTGEGVSVAINDDGVDFAHPDLLGTQKIYSSTVATQYNGYPYVFSPFSMLAYAFQEILGQPYISGGYPSVHYVDTSEVPAVSTCGPGISCFEFTPMIDFATPGDQHTYIISNTMSLSGELHVGTHPDRDLRDYVWGELPAVLVVDPNVAGEYDTVYVDLDNDYDFRDEKPMTRADVTDSATLDATKNNPVSYRDMNGDGLNDLSGGMLYFIANGQDVLPVSDWLWGATCNPAEPLMCPGNGDLIALSGSTFDRAYSHGTQCASNVVGQGVVNALLPEFIDLDADPEPEQPSGAVFGMAPDAKVVNVSDIYYNFESSKIDAYTFEAIGYDGIPSAAPGDTDAIQVTSNSYGSSDQDNDGWEYDGQYVSQVIRYYAPQTQFLFSTGNGAPAYGTVAPPSPNVGIAVGASTEFGSTGWDSITSTQQIMYNDVIPFSNRGPSARGNNGVDVVAGGAYAAGDEELNYYSISTWGELDGNLSWVSWGGTSRSAPVAAGVMALLYDAYESANDAWPMYDVSKAILQSSATDLNYDTFSQGSGSVNADTGTALAAGLYGAYVLPTEWNPGDFRDEVFPGFAKFAYPGDSFSQTFEVYNPTDQALEAHVTADSPYRIGSSSFEYTITPEMYTAKPPDNFYKAPQFIIPLMAEQEQIDANTWWDNPDIDVPEGTTLMIVRMILPFDQFDPNGDYVADNRFRLMVYNWMDVNGDNDVWDDANDNGLVDFTTVDEVTTIDGGQELDWATAEVDRWEYSRFGYSRPGGNSYELWVHDPEERMLDGLFIGLQQYPSSIVQETTLSFQIDFYANQPVEWLSVEAGPLTLEPGANTFEANVTVPMTMPTGAHQAGIKVHIPALDDENVSYAGYNTVVPVVLNVGAEFDPAGTVVGGPETYEYDLNRPFNNAAVRGLFDWTWRAESGDWRFFFVDFLGQPTIQHFEGVVPPGGWTVIDDAGTGNVWNRSDQFDMPNLTTGGGGSGFAAMAASGTFDWCAVDPVDTTLESAPFDLAGLTNPVLTFASNFQDYLGAGEIWVYASDDTGATWDEIYHASTDEDPAGVQHTFDLSAYGDGAVQFRFRYSDNGDGCAWFWQIDNVRVVEADQADAEDVPDPVILSRTDWDDQAPATDIDTMILGPTPSPMGRTGNLLDFPEPDYFGPYFLETVGKSDNFNVGAGIWNFNTTSGGAEDWVTAPMQNGLHEIVHHNILFQGDKFWVPFTTTLGTLAVTPGGFNIDSLEDQGVLGEITVSSSLPLTGLVAEGYISARNETLFDDEPLGFTGEGTIEWTHIFTVENGTFIDVETFGASMSDLDLYLHFWDGSSWVSLGSSAGSSANESIHINNPADGRYRISIDNYSGPAGTFDLSLVVGTRQGGITITGLPEGGIAPNEVVTLTVHYDFPFEPFNTYYGEIILGIPEAPDLYTIPLAINRIHPINKTVDLETAFQGDPIQYTIELYNSVDANAVFTMTDVLPEGVTFVDVTGGTYITETNTVVFSGNLPLTEAGEPSHEILIDVTLNADLEPGATITNTATLQMEIDGEVTTYTASAGTRIGAGNLSTSYKMADSTVSPGGWIYYDIHLINTGEAVAQNVTLTDVLPEGTTFVSLADPTGAPPGSFQFNAADNQLEWNGNITPGQHLIFEFFLQVDDDLAEGTVISNTAVVEWDGMTLELSDTTTVGEAGLLLEKTAPAHVLAGDELIFNLTYTNTSPMTLTNLTLVDWLPDELTSEQDPSWTIDILLPGQSGTVVFTTTVDAALDCDTSFTNVANISSEEGERATAVYQGAVTCAPVASFEVSDASPRANEVVTFTNTTVGVEPISYLWDFGDGITSTLESPTHTFTAVGTYTVTLTATNEFGSDTATMVINVGSSQYGRIIYFPLIMRELDGPTPP